MEAFFESSIKSVGVNINQQARIVINNVLIFLSEIKEDPPKLKELNFNKTRELTAKICGVSLRTVYNIQKECAHGEPSCPREQINKPRPVTGLNDLYKSVIKEIVASFFSDGEYPSVKKIMEKSKERIEGFQCGKTSMKKILKELGYEYKTTPEGRKLLVERHNSYKDIDKQQCLQATQPPNVTNVTASNLNQVNAVRIKEDPEDNDIDIGPTVLQHMDSHYRTGQTNIKQEDEVCNGDDAGGLWNVEYDQVLHSQVNVEFTADSEKVTEPDHSQFRCDKCFKILQSKGMLVKHHKQVHSTVWFKCEMCKKKFKRRICLANHIRKIHSDQEYECDICKKICKSKQMLRKHVWSTHRDSLADSHKCSKCLKKYSSKNGLKAHYERMHGTGSHKCTECDMEFKCKAYLSNHLRIAHSMQQYKCDMCNKIFKSRHALSTHIWNHHHKSEDMEKQQCLHATELPVVPNVAAGNLNQVNAIHIKEDPEKNYIDIKPTVLQHMNSDYITGQTNIKQEDDVHNGDDD